MAGKMRNEASSSSSKTPKESVVVDWGRRRSSCGYCRSPRHNSFSHGPSLSFLLWILNSPKFFFIESLHEEMNCRFLLSLYIGFSHCSLLDFLCFSLISRSRVNLLRFLTPDWSSWFFFLELVFGWYEKLIKLMWWIDFLSSFFSSIVTGMWAHSLTVDDYQGWCTLLFLRAWHSSQFDIGDFFFCFI